MRGEGRPVAREVRASRFRHGVSQGIAGVGAHHTRRNRDSQSGKMRLYQTQKMVGAERQLELMLADPSSFSRAS